MNNGTPHGVTRRLLLLAPLLSPVRSARAASLPPGIPPSRQIAFEVFRNGSKIGSHTLDFTPAGDRLTVNIDIKIAVAVGPITVFRYTMDGQEVWHDGQFATLATTTNDNGEHHSVAIQRSGDGLLVQSSGFPPHTAPAQAAPLTHWSIATLSGPLLSPQDGQPMTASVTPLARQSIALANGHSVTASGFDIATHTPTQDWYDPDQIWVSLRAKIRDGSVMEYRRVG